jgi:hypothetical protein
MPDATWAQIITSIGAVGVLTWVVFQLVGKEGKLQPRWVGDEKDVRIAKLEAQLERSLSAGERTARVAEVVVNGRADAR